LDLVGRQRCAAQQRKQRHLIRPGHTLGVADLQPTDYRPQKVGVIAMRIRVRHPVSVTGTAPPALPSRRSVPTIHTPFTFSGSAGSHLREQTQNRTRRARTARFCVCSPSYSVNVTGGNQPRQQQHHRHRQPRHQRRPVRGRGQFPPATSTSPTWATTRCR
jgi:hypothetical protein